jgi:hypothetical protein
MIPEMNLMIEIDENWTIPVMCQIISNCLIDLTLVFDLMIAIEQK